MSWKQALKTFYKLYSESNLTNEWIIVGSVGSVMQKAIMTPNDLDIYVQNIDDVKELAQLLNEFNLKTRSNLSYFDVDWLSSNEEPYFTQTFPTGFTWTKGKWKIHDFTLEVVQISNSAGIPDSVKGEGIWEGGKYIWELKKYVEFENYKIPVVPLEIQLESNIRRNRQDRTDAILNALITNGYDKELLGKALSNINREKLKELF
jgi:NAD-dependent SIR2 family protein deacetylase